MALLLKMHPSPNDRLVALEQKLPPWFDTPAKPNPALDRLTALEAKLPPWVNTLAKPNPALVRFNQTFKQPLAAAKK